jgi:hypothetical protein
MISAGRERGPYAGELAWKALSEALGTALFSIKTNRKDFSRKDAHV